MNRMIGDNAAFRLNLMKHDAHVAGRDEVSVSRWGVARPLPSASTRRPAPPCPITISAPMTCRTMTCR
ncbi:hypothetical protein P4133_13245 [Pseudomonas aeruginosa]|nr:hypothetical protein [Pseudomonas aeruginosa]